MGALRFNPVLRFDEFRSSAAMVSAIVKNGEIVGIHRTFISDDGVKAFGTESKKMLGDVLGGAVYLGGAVDTLLTAEGIETGLAIAVSIGTSCASLLSASLMPAWQPPEWVKRVLIFPDNDAHGVGHLAALKLREALLSRGVPTVISRLPKLNNMSKGSCDYLDVFNEDPGRVVEAYQLANAELDLCFGQKLVDLPIGGRR